MELRTERLILRELVEDDWEAIYAFESDPEVVRFQSYPPRTPAECRAYVAAVLALAAERPRQIYELGWVAHGGGPVIGRCGFHLSDPEQRRADLWFALHRAHWGRGLATEAVGALISFARELEVVRHFVGECDPRNEASARVMQKLGMIPVVASAGQLRRFEG